MNLCFLRTVSRCMGNIGYFVLFPIRLLGLMITRNPLKDCTESLENETEIRERNLLSDSASEPKNMFQIEIHHLDPNSCHIFLQLRYLI